MILSTLYLLCISIMILFILADIILCIITIYQLYFTNSYIWISTNFKILTILTMLLYCLCTIGDTTQMIIKYKYYPQSEEWDLFSAYFATSKDAIYFFGTGTFFMLLIMRIKKSFQLSKCIMIYLSILLIILIICCIVYCFFVIYSAQKPENTMQAYWYKATYPVSVTDFVLSLSLLILFIYKIRNKDNMEGMEICDNLASIDYDGRMDLDADKTAIWNVMIKHCVLFGIASLSTQIWYITGFVTIPAISIITLPSELLIQYTGRAITNAINIVILWLALKLNNDKYIYLCKCWHKCILKYCMKEDPDIMREGFVINDKERMLVVNELSMQDVEGPNLIVTNSEQSKDCVSEGPNVVMTIEIK